MPDPNLPPPDVGGFMKQPDEMKGVPKEKLDEAMDALGNPQYTTPPPLPTLPATPPVATQPTFATDEGEESLWSQLPGLRFGWGGDPESTDAGGWRLGPLSMELTRGCSCQALGCAAILIVALLTTGLCTFHLGPFHSQLSAGTTHTQEPTATAVAAGHCTGTSRMIVDLFFPDAAESGGATPPTFDTRNLEGGGKRYCMVHLATYHWANGAGAPDGGKLTLLDSHNKIIGAWDAKATPATAGVLANWETDIPTTPPVVLDGAYTVKDSGANTWSWSKASGGKGFVRVWAEDYAP